MTGGSRTGVEELSTFFDAKPGDDFKEGMTGSEGLFHEDSECRRQDIRFDGAKQVRQTLAIGVEPWAGLRLSREVCAPKTVVQWL